MAELESQASKAEQRAFAVAKLKRAASLPRMKDGRRPPMHTEAVSEGEKATTETTGCEATEVETPPMELEKAVDSQEFPVVHDRVENDERKDDDDSPPPDTQGNEAEMEADAEVEERSFSPGPVRAKRRSRSRSRSRNSKDFKGKLRATQSPTPVIGGDSSDEAPPVPIALPMIPPLISPIPSHFAAFQASHLLRSPLPGSPEPPLTYPGTSPPTPMLFPTFEALLIRSNSAGSAAASRRMAMHKLTGGTEDYDPSPSPAPPPIPGKLGRNNTVAGGERIAARQLMLSRLTGRITKEADAEQASSEERGAPSPTPKRRRRRSRRGSSAANPAISDSEPLSTSPNTPLVPPTPLPPPLDSFNDLRAESATPNQASSSRNQSNERIVETLPQKPLVLPESEPQEPRRRSILIEDDEDEEERYSPLSRNPTISNTPPPPRSSPHIAALRNPHFPDPSANHSTDSVPTLASTVPIFMERGSPARFDRFPSSPFTTPLKEKPLSDDDEEQVLYPADTYRPRTPYSTTVDAYEREISWVASIVPEIRMPIDDDEEEEDEEEEQGTEVIVQDVQEQYQYYDEGPLSATSSNGFSPPEAYDDTSPRVSSSSKSIVIESETSADIPASHLPPPTSSAAALSQSASYAHVSDGSGSPQTYPTRLSIASRIQQSGERSPLNGEYTDWEERLLNSEPSSKRSGESGSPSTWEKVKNTFSRSASNSGRRSRTNSIVNRERHSSVSRESGASLNSGRTDRGDSLNGITQQVIAPPLMQSPSASASILSLSPHAPARGNPSPIPPVSSVDMSKYQNDKLFPFPGMKRLEEQRRDRARGFPTASASTPDVSMLSNGLDDVHTPLSAQSFNPTPAQTPDMSRERKLSHQMSDPRLNMRYGPDMQPPARQEYIDIIPASTSSGGLKPKLPMTFTDVKQWLSKNNKKKNQPPQTPPSAVAVAFSPSLESQDSSANSNKKPSLTDLLRTEKPELSTDWEDAGNTPTDGNADINGKGTNTLEYRSTGRETPVTNGSHAGRVDHTDTEKTPKAKKIIPLNITSPSHRPYLTFDDPVSSLARVERNLSATPDPSSSMSDDPPQSTSESSSTTSSQYSLGHAGQGPVLLERLDESLSRGSAPIDETPRKLLLSSPVLQVVNPNTVKDRFLFLFTDILVIAKPITHDHDSFMETYKPSPPDRKYVVKSVVRLRNLRFCQDRTEPPPKSSSFGITPRSPVLRSFVSQFAKDPDQAITSLFSKSSIPDDSMMLGKLIFKTLDLDRTRLGDYLSRRTSKVVLKAYLDSFGFAGLRIDIALRVFLHSVNVPMRPPQTHPALDYLLDAFASRWYEANARIVAYDKDMAIRLVRAIVQVNELLHGGIADETGPTGVIRRNVTSRDFSDAFRRYDPRRLVSDELLDDVYMSMREERLTQARPSPPIGPPDVHVTFKRPLPSRLTYKIQSDPIIIRLPQADPFLTLHLYGQDLVFEPSTLTFSKSPEASFRVSGTSLGTKTMVICRFGPNAIKYVGLPLSYAIPVERAFMRNTFQLAFINHNKLQRRYMFSVDDHLLRHQWAQSIKLQIDRSVSASSTPADTAPPGASRFYRATEEVAFRVLQETLISSQHPGSKGLVQAASNQFGQIGQSPITSSFFDKESSKPFTNVHTRSKSRSKMYHRYGAGKHELDLGSNSHNPSSSRESNDTDTNESLSFFDQNGRFEGKIWSGRDLELQCQQNSLIPSVLSYLQFSAGAS